MEMETAKTDPASAIRVKCLHLAVCLPAFSCVSLYVYVCVSLSLQICRSFIVIVSMLPSLSSLNDGRYGHFLCASLCTALLICLCLHVSLYVSRLAPCLSLRISACPFAVCFKCC